MRRWHGDRRRRDADQGADHRLSVVTAPRELPSETIRPQAHRVIEQFDLARRASKA
jgi:hypothetical protein